MLKNQSALQNSTAYYFNRSKDTNKENESTVITLFARLTRELTWDDGFDTYKKIETFWVDIEDIEMEEATEKMKSLPNCMQYYKISEKVFHDLYQLSKNCPKELYYVTPFHQESFREKFIT
ncbi:hypothetical protein [Planomicrobium sp. CPCC 101079]|uniref:hypothetical protein n=1 Tax=Planomicrobium sp. CPCC 101079 TaxID=2599618 RepID=UPI0011B3A94C|nr:hypothetical protein [Planomicrobium sp. CPCC 101079]TWT01805.1 hypothetical protein FQV28_14305 [Planomicrobium sp. CPCC 101079]